MKQQRQILIVQLRNQNLREIRRTAAHIGSVPGVLAVDAFKWNLGARSLIGNGPDVSEYRAGRRETEQRRCQGKPRSEQSAEEQ